MLPRSPNRTAASGLGVRLFLCASLALVALGACSAFGGSDLGTSNAVDDASPIDATGGDDANGATATDSGDAGLPRFPGTSFCADAGYAILCDDFDELGRDAGWKTATMDGGALSVQSTFTSGSAPGALAAELSDAGGSAYLVSVAVPVGAKGVSVDFDYYAADAALQNVTLARAGFGGNPDVLKLFALTGAQVRCLEFPAAVPAGPFAGVVHVHISGLGTEQVDCYANTAHIASTAKVVPANFQLEVGAVGSGLGAAILIDNLLVSDTP